MFERVVSPRRIVVVEQHDDVVVRHGRQQLGDAGAEPTGRAGVVGHRSVTDGCGRGLTQRAGDEGLDRWISCVVHDEQRLERAGLAPEPLEVVDEFLVPAERHQDGV